MDYKAILDRMYEECKEWSKDAGREDDPSKIEFLGSDVFDFTTYDGYYDRLFGERMLMVIQCLYEKRTFEFIGTSPEHMSTYLLMCNMPYLRGKLSWGGSIRGAWIDEYPYGEHDKEKDFGLKDETGDTIMVPTREARDFMRQLLEWAGITPDIAEPMSQEDLLKELNRRIQGEK